MAKGYWIVSVDVSNPESYKLYLAENRVAFRKIWCSVSHTRRKA
jgi:uncharacterized protein (DUF1330 family)